MGACGCGAASGAYRAKTNNRADSGMIRCRPYCLGWVLLIGSGSYEGNQQYCLGWISCSRWCCRRMGQAWQEPARFICTPHCIHMGESLCLTFVVISTGSGEYPSSIWLTSSLAYVDVGSRRSKEVPLSRLRRYQTALVSRLKCTANVGA